MGNSIKDKINRTLESQKRRNLSLGIFALIAALIVVCVALVSRQPSVAKTTTKTILDCHYTGNGAHTHNSDCYDENGVLVCPLKERQLHTHTDDCYSVNRTLICGLEESESHTHSDDCYKETRVLTCGKEEITESHTHGPGCFTTIEVPVEAPEQVLIEDLTKENADGTEEVILTVYVKAPEGALPVGTTMEVKPVSTKDVEDKVTEAVKKKTGEDDLNVKQVKAVDITFYDADGYEIEPAIPVEVKIISDDLRGKDNLTLVHLDKETEDAEVVDGTALVNRDDEDMTVGNEDALRFESKEFSPYIVVDVEDVKSDDKDDAKKDEDGDGKSEGGGASLPEQVLTGGANGVTVVAKAPEGAFLEGTQMVVDTVKTRDVKDEVNSVVNGEVKQITAVDISFVDADGKPVEPKAPIDVTMTNKNAPDEGEAVVVQVDGDGKASVVDQTTITSGTDKVYFETETSSTYAMVVTTLTKTLVASDGKTYEITVTFDESAKIPSDAELETREIVTGTSEENAEYKDYTTKTEKALGVGAGALNYARFFDISIVGKDGQKVQPADGSKLNVDIRLEDKDEDVDTQVVHFGDKTEVLDASTEGATVSFETTGFSVYAIVTTYTPTDSDPLGLTTQTYAIAYNKESVMASALKAKTKTVDKQNRLEAQSLYVRPDIRNADNSGVLLVAGKNTNLNEWAFEYVGPGNQYRIKTRVSNVDKYLYIDTNSATLDVIDAEGKGSNIITVTKGTGEHEDKWCFSVGDQKLKLINENDISKGFGASDADSDTMWLSFVKINENDITEDSFKYYTAKKVSVSDTDEVKNYIFDNDEVSESGDTESSESTEEDEQNLIVLYVRVWNEAKHKYEFFVVNADGSLIQCFDIGDSIEWIGNVTNTTTWYFTEYLDSATGKPNYYYELQNVSRYGQRTEPSVIAPQLKDGQILSKDTIGVNLNGRRYGQNYTTIIAWDDSYYEYAGLKVEDGHIVSCRLDEADDFYFAVFKEQKESNNAGTGELTEVKTIDSNAFGIEMKMIDFNNGKHSSGKNRDQVQFEFFGGSDNNVAGLLSTNLEDNGYPMTTQKTKKVQSLKNLYKDSDGAAFTGVTPVNNLFIESIYNESGYFEYDSTQNFATLLDSNGNKTNTFTVYDQLACIGTNATRITRTHGQFMPFDRITKDSLSTVTNMTDVYAQVLPDSDPRKGEKLYSIPENTADYFFGMEMTAKFDQTADGLDDWGHDIIFEFSGDDDFWLYVDGELVLDIGGVHSASMGKVNFRTGEVEIVVKDSDGNVIDRGGKTTLYDLFKSNYMTRGMSESEANEKLAKIFTTKVDNDGNVLKTGNGEDIHVFNDYSHHTMRVFYMERGAGASNLHMRFNLAAVKPGTFILSKNLTGAEDADDNLLEFPYQIYYKTDASDLYKRLSDPGKVVYKGTRNSVTYDDELKVYDELTESYIEYKDVFFLKPTESAEVTLPTNTIDYYVVECGINPDVYDKVSVNENSDVQGGINPDGAAGVTRPAGQTDLTDYEAINSHNNSGSSSGESTQTKTHIKDFYSGIKSLNDADANFANILDYTNHVREGAMGTLSIKKRLQGLGEDRQLYDLSYTGYGDPVGENEDSGVFEFRLYLGIGGELKLADMYPYFIKDPKGHYCIWSVDDATFVPIQDSEGHYKSEYSELTESEKSAARFRTSSYGAISKVPTGFTVEVRNLPVGTRYKVEERDWKLPKGYTRQVNGYERIEPEPCVTNNPIEGTIGITQASDGQEGVAENHKLRVSNQKGWGLTVEKVWTDKDFVKAHGDVYFAVYVKDGEGYIPYPAIYETPVDPEDEAEGDESDEAQGSATDNGSKPVLVDSAGRVRKLTSPDTEIYYFFEDLYVGNTSKDFSDFVIREVTVEDPVMDDPNDPSKVTGYASITPIGQGDALNVGLTMPDNTDHNDVGYKVSYTTGETTANTYNIRTDTVTNARPGGIELYKTDWLGNSLAGAVFRITYDGGENDGKDYISKKRYTSNEQGLITTAYLPVGKYLLTEVEAPEGYAAMDRPLHIEVKYEGGVEIYALDDDGTTRIEAGGEKGKFFSVDTDSQNIGIMAASVKIKDRPSGLKFYKVDGNTGQALETKFDNEGRLVQGAVFKLHAEDKDNPGHAATFAVTGFERITANERGVLENLDLKHLREGTYYLEETDSAGYAKMQGYLCFKINKNGTVEIVSSASPAGSEDWLRTEGGDDESGDKTFIIEIPNSPKKHIQILKQAVGDTTGASLEGAEFDLYLKKTKANVKTLNSNIDEKLNTTGSLRTGSDGTLDLGNLDNGYYWLKETKAPDGYMVPKDPILIFVTDVQGSTTDLVPRVTATQSNNTVAVQSPTQDNDAWVITVLNNTGTSLPSTGGAGTQLLYVLGTALVLSAAIGLFVRGRRRVAL